MGGILGAMLGATGVTTDTFSITAANGTGRVGYNDGTAGTGVGAFGTMNSGGTLTGGKIIAQLIDISGGTSDLFVRGFSSDPGITWLVSLTINSTTKTGVSATYAYDSTNGIAKWTWSTQYGLVATTTYPGSQLIHSRL